MSPVPSEPARSRCCSSAVMPGGPATTKGRCLPSNPSVPRSPGRPLKWSPCRCVISTASRRESESPARSAAICAPSPQSQRTHAPSVATASAEAPRSSVGRPALVPSGTSFSLTRAPARPRPAPGTAGGRRAAPSRRSRAADATGPRATSPLTASGRRRRR